MPAIAEVQIACAIFTFLLGLAFGSFLNVVLTRLPNDESIVHPGSHCRNCDHVLSWWENIPLLSWLLLRGRCRQCHTRISPRYPLIELAIATLWAAIWLRFGPNELSAPIAHTLIQVAGLALLSWLLVALATLDALHFWLPDVLTFPGIALGFSFTMSSVWFHWSFPASETVAPAFWNCLVATLAAAAIILIIRLAYWLVRRKEGMGLGDAKLMAMLGAWLGFVGALESFVLAIFAASAAALIWLAITATRRGSSSAQWAKMPLPLGTFLCLAALSEVFYPQWLWLWYARVFLP